ncbi:hypothetical protein O181_052717 [Austropuccinia psidii MF-1]|uniref:Uncharacterized protein n=1 Tax=Austropuccinia psidii MF-1 TaxID=1389203 RepID=A0A9Q3E888_9BASI|nr:hypothetical protein [Austropuccinia psidii MF-1]
MPSTRSGARYNPSSSSGKGYRCDYGRGQSVKEGQGSVNGSQTDKVCHYEADDTVLPSKIADTATRSLSVHIQRQSEGLQKCIAAQRVPDPCISVEKMHEFLPDCENIWGHPNTCKLLNGWHPLMEKKNMMLLTAEWRKNNPPPCKKVTKTAPVASSSNSNVKSSHKLRTRAKERKQPQNLTARDTESQRLSRMPWKMYFRLPEQ